MIVSVADNIIELIRDATFTHEDRIDVNMRLPGAVMGIFVWGSGFINIYTTMGGVLIRSRDFDGENGE